MIITKNDIPGPWVQQIYRDIYDDVWFVDLTFEGRVMENKRFYTIQEAFDYKKDYFENFRQQHGRESAYELSYPYQVEIKKKFMKFDNTKEW